MSYTVRYTKGAKEDLKRLYHFQLQRDIKMARRARDEISKSIEFLKDFPFACRKAMPDTPFLREILISFGSGGYVALFEIENDEMITVLAVRHQREADYR
ncbi:MAG: type II toxin-antitoxin system RelE/ParE family toxin [Gammaproteobacteria bacterium]|jgi:plasmid stabilization system protein ParE|nr:type II toxin-antitoxin system RelE/ParE family toxin [Gammaproteobacteria bacterium]MBT4608236.1 type II toxin-antitoxin system RelE/ParE family toxin [Thiotrichales bacterium]MBT3473914.1 type II toxin-antitoxin system RelE/ParE family toxin [Gammaproteobacteria bacterium]MBT3966066.1 type II toxin-antitoxin system RelE/ParE family toxin [Gammaproteobacteria bacterium]MBT4081168.1 type II toxin-antitoxin system RelE/ParE family toxin [Gammaproteobacteria bacterium]